MYNTFTNGCFNSHFFHLSGKVLFLIFFKALFQGLIFGGDYIFGGAYLWREISVSKSIGLAL